jgi:hypothetical protein
MNGVENFRELVGRYSDTSVVDLDSQQRAAAAASDEDSPTRTRIFQGIADEIAQDALQQDGVAHDYGTGPARAKRKALAVSQVLVVATKPVEDGRKHDRRRLDVGRMLMPGGALQSANQAD